MKVQGRENADWSSRMASDGWHTVVISEEIGYKKNKEGEVIKDKKGNALFFIPAVIKEEGDDDGIQQTVIASYGTTFGEQKIADVLAATKLFKIFEEKFPGDVSLWDEKVLNAVRDKLQGKFMKMRIETSKDGKYSNIVELNTVDAATPAAKRGGAKVEKKEAATSGDDW